MGATPAGSSVTAAGSRLSVRHRILLQVAVLAATAGVLGLAVVPHLPGPATTLGLPWVAWVAAFP
jgi:hypothetical protein